MMRCFTALLAGALSLILVGCEGSILTPEPVAARAAGGFFAWGFSPKFNQPGADGVVPCDAALEMTSGSLRPIFAGVFKLDGNDWTCARRFVEANAHRAHEVQVYLYYDIQKIPTLEELGLRAAEVRDHLAAIKTPQTQFVVMMALEDRFTDDQYADYAPVLEAILALEVARNPLDPRAESFGRLMEVHGADAMCLGKAITASQDGDVFSEEASLSWILDNLDCGRLLLWDPGWNGLCVEGGEAWKCVPIEDRVLRFENIPFFKSAIREASI